jgi:hypothetical protein
MMPKMARHHFSECIVLQSLRVPESRSSVLSQRLEWIDASGAQRGNPHGQPAGCDDHQQARGVCHRIEDMDRVWNLGGQRRRHQDAENVLEALRAKP